MNDLRSVPFKYQKDTENRGISTLRFTVPEQFYQSPEKNQNNKCYCVKTDRKYCDVDGILDVSQCKGGAPLVISAPHFYMGSQSLVDQFVGLKPDQQKHETFLDIEPVINQIHFSINPVEIIS